MLDGKKKVILTGATGAIGIAIVKRCYELNWDVCAIVRPGSNRNRSFLEQYGAHIIECDLAELRWLRENEFCRNADYFLHLGWSGTFGEQRNDEALQLKNAKYALEACATASKLGCEVFLFAGSQAEFGRVEGLLNENIIPHPENAYGKAKLKSGFETRKACEASGLRHIYTRILSVYGPGDGTETMVSSTVRKLRDGISPQFTPGEQMWDYLYSDDAAEALLLLCQFGRGDKIYCLGSGTARPLCEYIETIGRIVNPDIPLGIGELPYRENQVMYLCADISDLTGDTGFMPKISFEEGIRRVMESNE